MKQIQGPRGRIYPDHSPNRVALIGMGPSFQDYLTETLTQELTPEHHDEVWGINMIGNVFRCDYVFWMDDLKQQSEIKQFTMLQTANIKAALSGVSGLALIQAGGPVVENFVNQVLKLPEWVRFGTYDSFAAGFDQLTGYMQNLALGTVLTIKNAMIEDRKVIKPDDSATLAGLIKFLDKTGVPVITSKRYPDLVRNSFDYPIDEVCGIGLPLWGKPYLNNGVAQAVAYAILKGVKHLKIYGCDFTYPNREYAEEGRACVEAWTAVAIKSGMAISLAPHTSIMDMVKSPAIYGYAEPPEIEYQGQVMKFGPEQTVQTPVTYQAPDTRNEANNVVSHANQADSATGPKGSKRRLRAPAGIAGGLPAADANPAQA